MCKISVIVPVYNAAKFISDTLNSIQSQTINDIEILCIDDGSTDDSAKIIQERQVQDARIKYEYQSNQGAGAARNRGIEHSAGEFIAFMDADDGYPDEYALERLYMAAKRNRAFVCGGSAQRSGVDFDHDGKRIFDTDGFVCFADYQFDFLFQRFIFRRSFIMDCNIRFPDLRVYEDPLFLINALIKAKKFFAIHDCVYRYNGAHQAQTMSREKAKDYLKGLTEELTISAEHQSPQLHRAAFERLEKEAGYFAEQYLYSDDLTMLSLILDANGAINKSLLGLDQDYVLPAIVSLWKAGTKYMKMRNKKIVQMILHLLKK